MRSIFSLFQNIPFDKYLVWVIKVLAMWWVDSKLHTNAINFAWSVYERFMKLKVKLDFATVNY